MKFDGCSNAGLSYTDKYKRAIINLSNWVEQNCTQERIVDYSKFQKSISETGVSDESEVRMIVPFLVKTGTISNDNCIRGNTRLRKLIINDHFFTPIGKMFIQFLKAEVKIDQLDNPEIRKQINKIYHDFGIFQFVSLCKSEDLIYMDLYNFLKRYNYIVKDEFFILTGCRAMDQMDKLDNYIKRYREGSISVEPKNNINCFQYIIRQLLQIGVIETATEGFKLSAYFERI